MTIPEGFEPMPTHGPAVDAWRPLYLRKSGGTVLLATVVRDALCNSHKLAHGGVIAALADQAMGQAYAIAFRAAHGELRGLLTLQMALDYIAAAEIGTWLQFEPRVVLNGKSRGIVDCLATADGMLVARAHAVFRPLALVSEIP